jgi:RNA polymerase sigma factor (sigma-70 family)
LPDTAPATIEDLLRLHAPQVLGALTRKYGQFDACEDATQLALLAASEQWPHGIPDNPRSWLLTVASRRLVDEWRADSARRRREERVSVVESDDPHGAPDADDTLMLLFLCCHPLLSKPSQLALTLRAVGGLTTAEIASAFLVPETTMGQRISRAKQTIQKSGAHFDMPADAERSQRLGIVLQVLYLIFNEGYTASSGPSLHRVDITSEAIRLTRMLHQLLGNHSEVEGLLALMLLTDARRAARTGADGFLIPLEEQDRNLWNQAEISEGLALVSSAMSRGNVGPYQLQAAIAALHDEAKHFEDTDWLQILALYTVLERVSPSPVIKLNRSVAVAHVSGARAGLHLLDTLDDSQRSALGHRFDAVRAHLLERNRDTAEARDAYLAAARVTNNRAEQRYLLDRASRL